MERSAVLLEGTSYPVRIANRQREIFLNGRWLTADEFIRALARDREYSKIIALTNLGRKILEG